MRLAIGGDLKCSCVCSPPPPPPPFARCGLHPSIIGSATQVRGVNATDTSGMNPCKMVSVPDPMHCSIAALCRVRRASAPQRTHSQSSVCLRSAQEDGPVLYQEDIDAVEQTVKEERDAIIVTSLLCVTSHSLLTSTLCVCL